MSQLKFICPACGQHIECNQVHAGEHVPCPSCAVQIRVPHDALVVESKETEPAADENPFSDAGEKMSYTALSSPGEEKGEAPPPAEKKSAPAQEVVSETEPERAPPPKQNPPPAPVPISPVQVTEFHCVCPACQSELRIRAEISAETGGAPHEVTVQPATKATAGSAPEDKSGLAAKKPVPKTATEREEQIAAARGTHPVQANPTMKPRLAYVLTGEAPVPPKPDAAPPPDKDSKFDPSDFKTLRE